MVIEGLTRAAICVTLVIVVVEIVAPTSVAPDTVDQLQPELHTEEPQSPVSSPRLCMVETSNISPLTPVNELSNIPTNPVVDEIDIPSPVAAAAYVSIGGFC